MEMSGFIALVTAVGLVLSGVGYSLGVFLSSRRKGVADSLETALNEVTAMRLRADRLAEELANLRKQHDEELTALRRRMAILEAENNTLRETLQTGIRLAPEFEKLVAEQLARHEERSEAMLALASASAMANIKTVLDEYYEKTRQRHLET